MSYLFVGRFGMISFGDDRRVEIVILMTSSMAMKAAGKVKEEKHGLI